MPRRPIRCRYYTDSGEPSRGGCRRIGAGCSFVHPDDPAWADAEIPSFRPTNKGGDSSTSKTRDEGSRRSATGSSGWGTGDNVSTNATGTSGWGSSSGWDTGGGWGSSAPTAPEPAQRRNPFASSSWGASTTNQDQSNATRTANGSTKDDGDGWGASGDKSTGSAWGGSWGDDGGSWAAARNEAWGAGWGDNDKDAGSGWGVASNGDNGTSGGSWGNKDASKDAESEWGSGGGGWGMGGNKDTSKEAGSGWGSGGWGTGRSKDISKGAGSGWGGGGWGAKDTDKDVGSGWGGGDWGTGGTKIDTDKDAGSGWGSAASNGWGAGDKDVTSSRDISDPMVVDNSGEKGTELERNKKKGKGVLAPPRIRIPDKENKKLNPTGTNNESLGSGKQWGDYRNSDLVTASTPLNVLTPLTTTSIDSIRVKRRRDVALDDKADIFKEYTKAWERGVRARFLLAEAEVKRDRWFRTQKSACYARIGEAGRKILDDQRAECDEQVNIQREKVSAAITSLMDFHGTIASNIDLGQRYDLGEETKRFLTDSKAYVDEVRALIVMHVLKEKDDAQSSDQKHPSGTIATLIDCVQNQVREFEERFEQTQTELTLCCQRDIRSEVDKLLQANIAESRVARQREVDRVASQSRPKIVIPPNALNEQEVMGQQVRELDAKVPQTVEDIRSLLLRVDATTKRMIALEQEVSANKETYEKQRRDLVAERESVERKIDGELEHLRNKFTGLVASQPSPQLVAYKPAEKLLETLLPAFEAALNKFYEREVLPTIKSTQQAAVDESNRHQEETIKVLWGKIQPAMNMVAGVSQWLDSQELRLTAPVEVETTLSS